LKCGFMFPRPASDGMRRLGARPAPRSSLKAEPDLERPGSSRSLAGNVLNAAFLIRRGEWIHFVERLSDWERRIGGLRVDVTGPWPAWDFVQLASSDSNKVEIET